MQDLGVDVDPERFIQESERLKPTILGFACLFTTGLSEIKVVIDMLKEAKIRSDPKLLLGGNAVTKEFAQQAAPMPPLYMLFKASNSVERPLKMTPRERNAMDFESLDAIA